jgi:hypothetical protein
MVAGTIWQHKPISRCPQQSKREASYHGVIHHSSSHCKPAKKKVEASPQTGGLDKSIVAVLLCRLKGSIYRYRSGGIDEDDNRSIEIAEGKGPTLNCFGCGRGLERTAVFCRGSRDNRRISLGSVVGRVHRHTLNPETEK